MTTDRKSSYNRKTNETDIKVSLNIDGKGAFKIDTPIPFFTHMLEQFSKHSLIDIELICKGDFEVDAHHSLEDIGWALGKTISDSLGDRKGIERYFSISLPMDETLTSCSIDISGRPWLVWKVVLPNNKIGNIDSEIFREFFHAFSQSSKFTIHIENKYGTNAHHIIESCFKALAICLYKSLSIDTNKKNLVPSTKGTIS